jgi:quercetin dioxygenase-like cupin family protein
MCAYGRPCASFDQVTRRSAPSIRQTSSDRQRSSALAHDETSVPVGVYRVAFADGARTNWHRHSGPQWLFIVEGRVRVQVEGGDVQDLQTGDAVVIVPGERHWHGAAPGSAGTHIAVNVNAATTWMDPVRDEELQREVATSPVEQRRVRWQ